MATELVKAIKPKKLNIDAVRREIEQELKAEGEFQVKEFNKTTQAWRGEKPSFEALTEVSGEDVTLIVGPTGSTKAVEKWTRLDEGTLGHYVPKSGIATMAFHPNYTRSTTPRKFTSKRGGPSGNRIVRRGRWKVGPIPPRFWLDEMQKRRRRPYTKRMIAALNRGLAKR